VTPVVLVAGMSLVILHRVDGGAVIVAPEHITSMHSKALGSARDKLITGEVRCIIWLDDGKLLSVLEPCDVVKQLMDKAAQK
jgi:hypothetical protein